MSRQSKNITAKSGTFLFMHTVKLHGNCELFHLKPVSWAQFCVTYGGPLRYLHSPSAQACSGWVHIEPWWTWYIPPSTKLYDPLHFGQRRDVSRLLFTEEIWVPESLAGDGDVPPTCVGRSHPLDGCRRGREYKQIRLVIWSPCPFKDASPGCHCGYCHAGTGTSTSQRRIKPRASFYVHPEHRWSPGLHSAPERRYHGTVEVMKISPSTSKKPSLWLGLLTAGCVTTIRIWYVEDGDIFFFYVTIHAWESRLSTNDTSLLSVTAPAPVLISSGILRPCASISSRRRPWPPPGPSASSLFAHFRPTPFVSFPDLSRWFFPAEHAPPASSEFPRPSVDRKHPPEFTLLKNPSPRYPSRHAPAPFPGS